MCSSTPLSTASGAVGPGCWGEDCMVRVTGLPRVSERRLVAAGGRLGGLAAPARVVAVVLGRRGLLRCLGHGDLDGRAPLALRGLPGAALEPAHDHGPGPLAQAPAGVLGLVAPDVHPEVGRLPVLPA